jgi:molybdopterin-containing oxidoreductase family iron-sulfur binding subunit
MKTIPPVCNEPESGPKYWRSLDQLADRPEFRKWMDQEFPIGASIAPTGETRRDWMKLMSASFLLAGVGGMAGGCRRPEEHLLPFAKQPENYTHGGWQYFATSMPSRGGAVPLVAKSSDGRPTKLEGNPLHPDGNGGTDVFAQAALLNLYDPDRAARHTLNGNDVKVEKVRDALAAVGKKFAATAGDGLAFLSERGTSPSLNALRTRLQEKLPKAKWFIYEPIDFNIHRQAAGIAFGADVNPHLHLDKARRILSLDCDFIGAESDSRHHIAGFTKGRKPGSDMNRLYVVESLFSLTGGQADHRVRAKAGDVIKVAAQVASFILGGELGAAAKKLASGSPASEGWAKACAEDLKSAAGAAVVVAGYTQPLEVHLLAHAINTELGAVGKVVEFLPSTELKEDGGINECVASLNAGLDTLVILGGNPAYNAPGDLDFATAASKAATLIRLGYYEDETSALKPKKEHWHLASAHFLEAWGDSRSSDGSVLPIQPLIEPLLGGLTDLEVLARLLGETKTSPYDIVRANFTGNDQAWKAFLHDGYLKGSAAKPVEVNLKGSAVVAALAGYKGIAGSGYQVVLYRDAKVDDGRYANNGWLQELPDPITKTSWENVVMVSPATGKELGVSGVGKDGKKLSDDAADAHSGQYVQPLIEVTVQGKTVKGPVWIQPGMADGVIGLAVGYGRRVIGRVGAGCGFNVYSLYSSTTRQLVGGATAKRVAGSAYVATVQEHGLMEGRPVIREANLSDYTAKTDFARHMDLDEHLPHYVPHKADGSIQNIYNHPYEQNPFTKSEVHQWGMTIDLSSCVGCAACTVACQAENNIPIVGKDQIIRGREMHWIRIDRYYSHDPEKAITGEFVAADPQMVVQPMFCQHCESAPCESVCPVNATVHDEEGLNVMAYNRCIGTRYCANNCPFKVRRFNFFDFNKREISYGRHEGNLFLDVEGPLYHGPLGPNKNTDPQWEIIKLVKNPDVSVRMRGVMEKCTFCVQRIEQAKIAQKNKARDSAEVAVPDGTFKTACQQACPAEAIQFGNTLDANSVVSKLKKDPRNYSVLGFLDIKPRVTYLARVRNPNPEIAKLEGRETPDSMRDYEKFRHENPFHEHGESHAGHDGEKKGAA